MVEQWGHAEHAENAAGPVVETAAGKKRAVAAIVLDHEQAHEEARGRDRQDQAEPVGIAEAEQHSEALGRELTDLQELLFAAGQTALLIVLPLE